MTIKHSTLIPVLVLLFSAIFGRAVLAQEPSRARSEAAEAAELRAYRLTIEDVRKWHEAGKALTKMARANPELEKLLEGLEENESLAQMQRRFERAPEVRRILQAHGLTPRKTALIILAYAQAALFHAVEQQGGKMEELELDQVMNPANRGFYRRHEAELKRLEEEVDALKKDVP